MSLKIEVQQILLNIKCDKEKFKNFSAGAPSMILQNGFGQALAFWLSKGTDKHIAIFDIIKNWLSYEKDDIKNSMLIYLAPNFL